MFLKSFLSGISVACLVAATSYAAEPLSARVEVGMKGGTDRSLLTTEFWAPLAQKSDRVLYGDIRLMGDNDENREGNLGLGYRQIVDDAVLGVHGWIDRRRTQNNSTFHQLTFGVERLGHIVDARANVYVPLNQSRNITTPNIGQASPYLAGTGIFFDTNGLLQETPQYGVDGEIGYRIPVLQRHADAIRVYGGGYHFFRDETQDVTGFRVRTEAQVNSAFSVGARFQHDDPRGSQGFLEATIKFPFGAKKLYQTDYLRARLDESPERDVDIVTAARQIDSGLRKPVLNETTGAQQRILHVDNTNSTTGNGSVENPFNTLKAAEAEMRDNDILYVNRGTGTTTGMDQGIIINKNNVQLIGSGSALTFNGLTLRDAGLAPIITNSQARATSAETLIGNGVLVTGQNATLSGLSITNAQANAVYVVADNTALGNFTARNLSTDTNGGTGVEVRLMNGGTMNDITITDSLFERGVNRMGTEGNGVRVYLTEANSRAENILIDNVEMNTNAVRGAFILANAGTSVGNAIIRNSSATGNTNQGLRIGGNGQISYAEISDSRAISNGNAGINIITAGGATIDTVQVLRNTAIGNTTDGFYISPNELSKYTTLRVMDNVAEANTTRGIYVYVFNGSEITHAQIENNTTTGNTAAGIQLTSQQNSTANGIVTSRLYATVHNNVSTGNGTGIGVTSFSSNTGNRISIAHVALTSNVITGNTSRGVAASKSTEVLPELILDMGGGSLLGAGSLGNNSIYNNPGVDFYADRGTAVIAQGNWWGVSTGLDPARQQLLHGATVDASNYLTTDPQPPASSP